MTTTALANVQYRPTELDTNQLGQVLVKSGFFQDTKDVAQAIVKVLAGRELGFGPIASMQGVYIVKGRVTLSANLVGAAIQRSGKYSYRVLEQSPEGCSIDFYELGAGTVGRGGVQREKLGNSTFTIQDAQAAGIAGDTYKKFPRNMLFARALTNGARWYCPEVFNGPIYTPDELGAVVDGEGVVIEEQPAAAPTVDQATGEVQAAEPERDAAMADWVEACQEADGLGIEHKVLPDNADTAKIERWTAALHDKIYATKEANGGTVRNH